MSKAGLLTPGFQWQQFGRGYMMDRKEVGRLFHHARAARRSLNHNDLSALEVKFLILNPSDIAGLDKFAKAALNDPKKFRKITMVETPLQKRTIYEVLYK